MGRVPRDDQQIAKARQFADDLFGQAVGEVFLIRIAAEIVERQHCDRRPRWYREHRIINRSE
jgi:hypothetical protein